MEIGYLTQKLADIREKITFLVEEINAVADGESFYARIFLSGGKRIAGLFSELGVNEYKIIFTLTEDRLIEGKINQKISKKRVKFEEIRVIDVFKTASGKPMFITRK